MLGELGQNTKNTKVFYAAKENDVDSIKDLIEKGLVQVKDVDGNGQTIAHIAASNGNLDVLRYIARKDASILKVEDKLGRRPIELAVEEDLLDVVRCLVEEFAVNCGEARPIGVSVHEDRKFSDSTRNIYGNMVHLAVKQGHLNILKYFIEERKVNINDPYYQGLTPPVFVAIKYQQNDILKYLVEEKGADLTTINWNNENILFEAVRDGHFNSIKYVLDERKTELDIDHQKSYARETVVHLAVLYNRTNILEYLVVEKHANINLKDRSDDTPLHLAASSSEDITEFLLKKGAAFDEQNCDGERPLHLAAKENIFKNCEKLIELGADVNSRDRNGKSVLHVAVSNVWDLIFSRQNWHTRKYLGPAAQTGRLEICKYLVDHGADISQYDCLGRTPLYYALAENFDEISQLLIERGCNHVDYHNGAIHLAATLGREKVMKCLISEGNNRTDVNLRRKNDNWTALHCASLSGHYKAVKYLVKHGADIHARAKDGKVPAEVTFNERIIAYLNSHMNVSKIRSRRSLNRPITIFQSVPLPRMIYNASRTFSEKQSQSTIHLSRSPFLAYSSIASESHHLPSIFALFQLFVPSLVPQCPSSAKIILRNQIDPVAEEAVTRLPNFQVQGP